MKRIAALILLLSLAACGHPVPPEKANYVGEWQHPAMYLLITKDGSVVYKRVKGGGTVSVNAPLKEFQGDNFVAGMAWIAKGFGVDAEVAQSPAELRAALARARKASLDGKPYLIDAQVARVGVAWAEEPWTPSILA